MSGPLLFPIYINDLPHAVQNSVVSMYADDTSLCYQASDIETLNEAINNDLIQLETWLKGNKLSLNVAKTNSMLISTKLKHKGRVINYLWGGGVRHSHVFDGNFFPLSDLCKYFDPHPRTSEETP